MRVLRKVIDFITKDTIEQNESIRMIVLIRVVVLSLITYFTASVFLGLLFHSRKMFCFYALFLCAYIWIFVLSYHSRTLFLLWFLNVWTIIWIISITHCFGWNIGVQHFLVMLMILFFFSSYKKYLSKALFAVFVCGMRILLFYVYQGRTPIWPLLAWQENLMQLINTVVIFWCIAVISLVCSRDGREIEEKLVEYNNQLKEQANTDTLTGLMNRRRAMEYMQNLVADTQNSGGFCLCIGDIDFFKKVNDNYGHDLGDEVLKKIARTFESISENCTAARWGGEEFMLLFPNCNGDEAYIFLEDLQKRIRETCVEKNGCRVSVTMTFGLAEYDFINGLEATIKEADEKLYMGKNSGRDRIVF